MGSSFDKAKAYAPQEDGTDFFNDGREIELLHFVYSLPNLAQIRGSPAKVLAAIDEYARKRKYLMNVGEAKGKIVTDLIAEVKPRIMVELGGYVGYSSILFGNAVRKAGGKQYYSLEMNPEFAAVTMALVDLAGLSDFVKVVIGRSTDSLIRLKNGGVSGRPPVTHIDLLFLDHYKPAYVTDLKVCEYLRLVQPVTVLAADNVIKPGNPPYLEYVRSSVQEKRKNCQLPRRDEIVKFYGIPKTEKLGIHQGPDGDVFCEGNPNIVYESQLIKSFEPTGIPDGVEITRCVGEKREDEEGIRN